MLFPKRQGEGALHATSQWLQKAYAHHPKLELVEDLEWLGCRMKTTNQSFLKPFQIHLNDYDPNRSLMFVFDSDAGLIKPVR